MIFSGKVNCLYTSLDFYILYACETFKYDYIIKFPDRFFV